MAEIKLFTPLTLGGKKDPIKLLHRVVMAPLTRLRAGGQGLQPAVAVVHYKERATPGGLQIAEASNVSATARGQWGTPGLFTPEQVTAWQEVTKAVHEKEGIIFAQLWHTGRLGNAKNQPNQVLPVSCSAKFPPEGETVQVAIEGGNTTPIGPSRALRAEEIPTICEDFGNAAANALAAGFDGVEVNGANGFLLEQFLYDGINDRTDDYGGSVENRARFLLETVDAVLAKVDSSRVGVRLSPFGMQCGQYLSKPQEDTEYVLTKLAKLDLAYVHLVEPRDFHKASPVAPKNDSLAHFARKVYSGVLITASGYSRASAIDVVADGDADLVAFGRSFLANPDLVECLRADKPLRSMEDATPDKKDEDDEAGSPRRPTPRKRKRSETEIEAAAEEIVHATPP